MSGGEPSRTKEQPKTIATRIREERERRAWTQSQVAERIGSARINISRFYSLIFLALFLFCNRSSKHEKE